MRIYIYIYVVLLDSLSSHVSSKFDVTRQMCQTQVRFCGFYGVCVQIGDLMSVQSRVYTL